MRVLVVNNMVPFIWGGAEELAKHLVDNLNATRGVEAEVLRIPFKWEPAERIFDEMYICRSFRLWRPDRVIALKFPAYLVPHEHKILWLLHQYRQAYELYGTDLSNIPQTPAGEELRKSIIEADNRCFEMSRKIFTLSGVTQKRLHKFNGFQSEVLHHPLNDPLFFENAGYGNYIFAGGRINAGKRQHLLVEAMAKVNADVRLVIAGPPDTAADAQRLQNAVRDLELEGKVELDLRFLPRDLLAKYVNSALACAYLPVDEDSVGYVTMESLQARKAVLTATDSGGVLDVVRDGESGLVVSPDITALADAIEGLARNRSATMAMGAAGQALLRRQNITWPRTIEKLLS